MTVGFGLVSRWGFAATELTSLLFSLRWLRLLVPLPGESDWWPGSPVVHAHHPFRYPSGSGPPQLLICSLGDP